MQSRKLAIAPWLFAAPALIMFGVFVIYPIIGSIRLSFYSWDGLDPTPTFVGLENYRFMFAGEIEGDFYFWPALKNNILWLLMFPLAIPIGLGMAIFLNQNDIGARIAKSLFFFPFVISAAVIGVIFAWFYDPRGGVLQEFVAFLPDIPWLGIVWPENLAVLEEERFVTLAIIFAGLYPQIAYCMILYLTGLSNVAPDQIEAGRLDGARGFKMFWYVVLPQLWPATFLAVVVTIIGALRSFDLVEIMTDGGPYGTGSTVLAHRMFEESITNFNVGYSAALATVLFLIMDIFIAVFLYIMLRDQKR